mgnify:FL=1
MLHAGFDFTLTQRNVELEASGQKAPKTLKTGTTIVGVVFSDGVVLGADTRATEGSVVADKRCKKIHDIAPNIKCCGAGTAADTEMTTKMISLQLKLHRMETGKQVRVQEALTMLKRFLYSYGGEVSAALVLGGVDVDGPFLATIAPHGSTDRLPFVTMGSGSIAAMSMLETGYRDGLNVEEAKKLVHAAVTAGILNDPYSGSQVDLCVITKRGAEMLYATGEKCTRIYPRQSIPIPPGSAVIKKEEIVRMVTVRDEPVETD